MTALSTGPGAETAALDLDVAVEAAAWARALPGLETLARAAVGAALRAARADGGGAPGPLGAAACEMSLLFADDARLRALNRDFRGKDAATNVLAFANTDAPPPGAPWQLGDVVLALETARAEAAAARLALADHVAHLVVHGTLHLFGYDHVTDAGAARMEGLETRILSSLGIADPYAPAEGAANRAD